MQYAPSPKGTEISQKSPAASCLWPLLSALEWPGEARHVFEAFQAEAGTSDFASMRATLANLNYSTISINAAAGQLTEDDLPVLLVTPDADIWVIIEHIGDDALQVFKGLDGSIAEVPTSTIKGRIYLVRQVEPDTAEREPGRFGWLSLLLDRERGSVQLLFAVTFLINSLTLSLPLYMLTVFDLAISTRSSLTLASLGGAVAILLTAEMALREIRAQAIAKLAVRTQNFVITSLFERILRLPLSYIENASVAGQLNRLRTFEAVREIFSGPLAASLLDVPFVIVFVVAVFLLAGSLGWLIVIFIAAVTLLAIAMVPRVRLQTQRAGIARSETRIFRDDLTNHLSTLHDTGAERIWMLRYRNLIARHLHEGLTAQRISFIEQSLAQAFSIATGALIVGFGATKVMDGELSIGALSAVMAIVWRVLSPIQTILLNLSRVFQSLDTAKQINQLMTLPQESKSGIRPSYRHIRGHIALENVSYRNNSHSLPILRGIDLTIEAGELLALTGAPGPSRSTILKLIANLNQAGAGRIRIDDCDIQQFDPREFRRCVALVSDEQAILSGTLEDNLRLCNPLAEDHEIHEALIEADLLKFVEQSEKGLATDLTDLFRTGSNASICQKIKLARAYLLSPAIYLFDEPLKDLDPSGQSAFLKKLHVLKGKTTVIVRTSDERIMKLADKRVFLHAGRIVAPPLSGGGNTPAPARNAQLSQQSKPDGTK